MVAFNVCSDAVTTTNHFTLLSPFSVRILASVLVYHAYVVHDLTTVVIHQSYACRNLAFEGRFQKVSSTHHRLINPVLNFCLFFTRNYQTPELANKWATNPPTHARMAFHTTKGVIILIIQTI